MGTLAGPIENFVAGFTLDGFEGGVVLVEKNLIAGHDDFLGRHDQGRIGQGIEHPQTPINFL
jgi:hypothetical protein